MRLGGEPRRGEERSPQADTVLRRLRVTVKHTLRKVIGLTLRNPVNQPSVWVQQVGAFGDAIKKTKRETWVRSIGTGPDQTKSLLM